jgi:hypothetical protein
MPSESRYLLIVACSQRKRSDVGLLPAIERYDGVSFRVLRKARREGYWPEGLDVLIVSAKYGLITASTPIADYDQRMTRHRASALRTQVMQRLHTYSRENVYREVYVDLGRDYRPAAEALDEPFEGSRVLCAEGRIGERLAQLRGWLVAKCQGE